MDTVENYPQVSDEMDIPPVDSYGKLINWLLKMSETENIDLDDPDFVTKIQQSMDEKPKRQFQIDVNRPEDQLASEACGGVDAPSSYSRSPISCEDIEEENELQPEYPAINLEVDTDDCKTQNTLLVRPRGILMKQRSVSSESSDCRTSGRSFDSDSEISNVLRIKEKILLQNRYQKFSRAKRQLQKQTSEYTEPVSSNFLQVEGPVLRKQKSESCAARSPRLSPRDFRDAKRYRKSSRSCNDIIDARLILPNPMHSQHTSLSDETNPMLSRQTTYSDERSPGLSRQTTYSDDRSPLFSRQCTFNDDDYGYGVDGERRETIKLKDMSSNIISASFDDYRLVPNNRRLRKRGRFSNTLSKSVGNLIDRSSRLRDSIRKKSSSLFTVKHPNDIENIEQDPEEREKVLDDRLLDGNMGDILYAMDALWPNTSFT